MNNEDNRFCILCGQGSTSTIRLYRVPKDEKKRQSWIESCGRLMKLGTYVCSKHFLPEFMGMKKLKAGALPLPRTLKYVASRQNTDGTHKTMMDVSKDEIVVDNEKFEVKIESTDEEPDSKKGHENRYNTIDYEFTSLEDCLQGFKCPLCDYVSTVKNLLRTHMWSVHGNPDCFEFQSVYLPGNYGSRRPHYECQVCEFTSEKKFVFYAHLRSEHPDFKRFQCPFCDYSSNNRTCLKSHVGYRHTSLKEHRCSDCGFTTAHALSLKLHSKRRKFECDLCGFKACKRKLLELHVSSVHLHDETGKILESHVNSSLIDHQYVSFESSGMEEKSTDLEQFKLETTECCLLKQEDEIHK